MYTECVIGWQHLLKANLILQANPLVGNGNFEQNVPVSFCIGTLFVAFLNLSWNVQRRTVRVGGGVCEGRTN